jgi:diguanylate cyclase (GGDEF)-like protein/PAS domain S-box-containing protein
MAIQYPNFISQIFRDKPGRFKEADGETRFFQFTVFLIALLLVTLPFFLYHLLYGNRWISVAIMGVCLSMAVGWGLLYSGKFPNLVYRANSFLFIAFLFYLMILGTKDNSMILWMYLFPLIVFHLLGKREGAIWALILILGLIIFFFGPYETVASKSYSSIFIIRFLITLCIISIVTFSYERFRTQYKTHLEEQNLQLVKEIREREQAQRSLVDRDLRYKAIYFQAIEGILLIDNFGKIVECNPQILSMLGYEEDDLLGENVSTFIHPEDYKTVPLQFEKLQAGETILLERRVQTVSGVYLLCEENGKKLKDGLIILLYRDITERKVAEMALERANKVLDRLAHIDGLTHVANRRRFDKVLDAEWSRMQREEKMLGLILVDVDFFKQFNDQYGHQAGDECLLAIATALNSVIHRPGDLVARYGGEEFGIVLPDTDYQGCMKIGQMMNSKIENLQIPHESSAASSVVTVSLGIAALCPDNTKSWADLIGLADKALYRAKEEGRNRMC